MMNDLETKSGKLLLEKCIQNLDDITNLITFIEEKMESWSRLKVILIGEEIYIVLYLFVHFQILGDIEEGFHDNGDLPKFEPSPEAETQRHHAGSQQSEGGSSETVEASATSRSSSSPRTWRLSLTCSQRIRGAQNCGG